MTKPERKIVEKLLTCLDGQITQVPASKQELLDELAKSPFFAHVAFHNSQMVWDKKRVMTEIKLLSEPCWQSLLMRLAEELRRAARERELEDELTAELEARFPHEEFELRELVRYDRRNYGIKIYMCGQTYLFEYNGTIKQLAAALIEEVEDRLNEKVKCPYCGTEKPRHHWYGETQCPCGATVHKETRKTYSGGKYISTLAEEMRQRKAISVGQGSTNWEMWFKK
jgi:hypothetical protein